MAKPAAQRHPTPPNPPRPEPVLHDSVNNFESGVSGQRYLQLFERLSPLMGCRDAAEICMRSCEMIAELLEVAACSIMLAEAEGTHLKLWAATHIPREAWPEIRMPSDDGICGDVFQNQRSVLVSEREDFKAYFGRDPDARYASASCMAVPLLIQERTVGVVNVAHPHTRRPFMRRDIDLLEAVARMIGSALDAAFQFAEAHRLQQALTGMFNSLHVGLLAVDAEGRVSHSNQKSREFLGFKPVGRPPLDTVLHGTLYNVCLRLMRQVDEGAPSARDCLSIKHGAEKRDISVTAMSGVSEILGERLLMIEEVGQEEEMKRLREAENSKHSFLSIISHELRTPLTVMRSSLPLLAVGDKPIDPAIQGQLHRVLMNNCHRLTEVVNSILYVTEIETGTLELVLRPAQVNQLLHEVIERYAASAAQKRLAIETELASDAPEIDVDRTRLTAVLSELVNNAIKFSTPDKGIQIRTAVAAPWFEIVVTNVGARIDPCQRKDIFHKFYQGNQSMTRSVGGCGLGLFLVSNIVRLHGGTVELLDSAHEETTFRVQLPLERAPEILPPA